MPSIKRTYIRIAFSILAVFLTYYYFRSILIYILLAAVVSLIGKRLTQLLNHLKIGKFHLNKSFSAALTLLVFWLLLFTFFRLFVPLIIHEANELSGINIEAIEEHFQDEIKLVQEQTQAFFSENDTFDLNSYLQERLSSVLQLSQVKGFFSGLFGTVGDIFIAIFAISFMSFFFLKDDHLLLRMLLSLVPEGEEKRVIALTDKIIHLLGSYFIGLFIEVVAIIFLVTMGLWAVGIGFTHAIVIGLIAGMLNVIPYVGPLIAMLFGSIIAMATQLTETVPDNLLLILLLVVGVFLLAQLIDNFLLQPIIYSKSVNASPLEIFIVILMAGNIGGIGGMILAIPIYTIFRIIAKESLGQYKVIKEITDKI